MALLSRVWLSFLKRPVSSLQNSSAALQICKRRSAIAKRCRCNNGKGGKSLWGWGGRGWGGVNTQLTCLVKPGWSNPKESVLQPCVFFCLVLLTVKLPTILTGYSGDLCEVDRDDCAATTCPATATCIDGVNQAFCRCPVGRAAPTCTTGTDADGMLRCFLVLCACHCVMCVHVCYHALYEHSETRLTARILKQEGLKEHYLFG